MTETGIEFYQEPLKFDTFDTFKTEDDKTYIVFKGVNYLIGGSKFQSLLNELHFYLYEFFPCKGKVKEIVDGLDMFTKLFTPIKPVYYRFAKLKNSLFIDLGNPEYEAVEITPEGFKVIKNPEAKFIRSKIQRPIGAPDTKGQPNDLFRLKKYIPFKSDDDFTLFVSWLLACTNTDGGYPPLFLVGEQGSAKSTVTGFIKNLLDASTVPLRNLSKTMKNLMIAASNDYILCYDNISKITDKQSDNLCKLATGAGFTTRKLYTTTEEVQMSCKRPTIINTISFIPTRQDLLDRSVIVTLNFIKPEERKTIKELNESWEQDRPLIFGALCNAVSAALRNYDAVNEENLPRMADFAKWIMAAEEQLPWDKGFFMEALNNSHSNMVDETIDAEPVAIAILRLMAEKKVWKGTASDLLEKLDDCIKQSCNKFPNWPKLPNQLSRKLGRVSAFLREKGIQVEKGHSGSRFIELLNQNEIEEKKPTQGVEFVRKSFSAAASHQLPETKEVPEKEKADNAGAIASGREFADF